MIGQSFEKPSDSPKYRPGSGAWLPKPGPGRPKGLKDDPLKKARKQLIEEYKDALATALPNVSPVLIKKAVKEGDMQAIKEINDIIVEKAATKTDIKIYAPIYGGKSIQGYNRDSTDISTQ